MLGYEAILKKILGYGTNYRSCPDISSDLIYVVPLNLTHISI